MSFLLPILRRHPYVPLPTNSLMTRQKQGVGVRLVLYIAIALGVCVMILEGLRYWLAPPYSPLLDYQDLHPPPLIHEASAPQPNERAVVSALYSDSFVIGVAVLGHSVRKANVTARLLLPYLERRISNESLCVTRAVGWEPIPVPFIPPPHDGKGIHHRFYDQYTKLNIWALDKLGIKQAVYLDADTLVRRNFDELFDTPFNFAAVPDVYGDARGFPINFNAGVLVFRPSSAVLETMKTQLEAAKFPLKQAEQSFLNLFFATNTLRLPYAYNANLAIKISSPAMWDGMKDEMRIVHYTLRKPFLDFGPLTEGEASNIVTGQHNGIFAEEVEWWQRAYDQMTKDVGSEIDKCRR